MEVVPISYVQALFEVARDEGKVSLYKKYGTVEARPAKSGEEITTVIDGEEETKNTAKEGDMVVRTKKSGAEYIISGDKFKSRYEDAGEEVDADGYKKYNATGETNAFRYEGDSFKFEAPWGEEMLVNDGDYICAPDLKDLSDIYRIEVGEFKDTYKKEND